MALCKCCRLEFLLRDFLRANNVEPTQPGGPSRLSSVCERQTARSSVHAWSSVAPRSPVAGPSNSNQDSDVDYLDPSGPDTYEQTQPDNLGSEAADNSRDSEGQGATDNGLRERIQPDLVERNDNDNETSIIHLPDLQTTQRFIDSLHTAVLDGTGMDPEDLENLCNPGPALDLLDPSPLLCSIRHFINNANASRDHYNNTRAIELLNNPDNEFLSFDQVKRHIQHMSGVVSIEHDLCPESCIAYTGPYEDLDKCPRCYTTWYRPGSQKPWKRFTTVPIGPVLQAFYGSHEIADQMHYLEHKLAENMNKVRLGGGKLSAYDDTACGRELLDAWHAGQFKKADIALQLSIDGAQLWPDHPSEVWVFIWVIHNLPPDLRYKKAFVIPVAIVPGPNKPGDIDSYLFPSLYHVAALQHEGLRVYNAYLDDIIPRSIPLVIFSTADSLGNVSMSGMVEHSGKYGCCLHCKMPSRCRDGDSHYYPAMSLPDNYNVLGCCYPDVTAANLHSYRGELPRKYKENLEYLLAATTQRDYKACRLAVGLCKQTLFSGLPNQPLPVLSNFMMDIMHLSVLNDPDLFLKLFTGKLDCYEPDNRSTWDWAVFYLNPNLWNAHGETVVRAVPYIPSSFGHMPRDPAKKLNSGYKAWEFQQYIYGLGPTLFRHILPRKYWLNFCKLVSGIRILQHHHITHEDLLRGHAVLLDFVQEYEELYYQRNASRIHFVWQSIHLLTHITPEMLRAGPLACYAQWTLETAIGNLGQEIHQDRDLYANLAQQAILRAQVNSLQARFPHIKVEVHLRTGSCLPNNACVFESGYAFLLHHEKFPMPLSDDELDTLMVYWQVQGWPNQDSWPNGVCHWARLCLPNGQRARSVWLESSAAVEYRRTSCVEVSYTCIFHFPPTYDWFTDGLRWRCAHCKYTILLLSAVQ
jgi:hypothetical protein